MNELVSPDALDDVIGPMVADPLRTFRDLAKGSGMTVRVRRC